MESMREMSESEQEKRDTRQEASIICTQLETLEMAFLIVFWNTILETMQRTSVYLQHSLQQWITWVNSYRKGQMHIQVCYTFLNAFSRCRETQADRLIEHYPEDINVSIKNELTQLKSFAPWNDMALVELLKLMVKLKLTSTFSNVYIFLASQS